MSDASAVFRRIGTMGWLALAGSPPKLDQSGAQISERVLEVANLSRPPLLLNPDAESGPELLSFVGDIEILLGVEIQVQNPLELTDEDLQSIWLNAGIMIMAGGSQAIWMDLIADRLFRTRPQEILTEGAVLFAFNAAASLMGSWTLDQKLYDLEKGLGWVLGSIVLPTNNDPAEIASVHNHLEENPNAYALGLPDEAVFALGPDDQVEVWTDKAPILLLGKGWQR